MSFKAYKSGIQVNGTTILSVADGLGTFASLSEVYFQQVGLPKKIEPNGWYSQQKWLDAFKLIATKVGSMTLNQIGKKIPENAKFPPFVVDVDTALKSIDIAYHMNHSEGAGVPMFNPKTGEMKEGIGHYSYKKLGPKEAMIEAKNPYPCDFDMGIVQSMAKRFSKTAQIKHVEGSCRKTGDASCSYIVSWM